jgi:hypothetical protein
VWRAPANSGLRTGWRDFFVRRATTQEQAGLGSLLSRDDGFHR